MIINAQKYIAVKRFGEYPKGSDYVLMKYVMPQLPENHILVKVEWVSVDPYLFSYSTNYELPYEQFGYQIGIVLESTDKGYPVGTRVVSHKGWCDYCVIDPNIRVKGVNFSIVDFGCYKLPDLKGLPISLGIGAVGMPGATAYFGLLNICKPEHGQTVVVTSAAGAVGSIAGQIAKIKGCKVIGFTGSDEKVKWLTQELGFDYAFNYKKGDLSESLLQAAPDGIDCFFDNVGGELSCTIMRHMNSYGRVALCGTIGVKNEKPSNQFEQNVIQPLIMVKQLTVEGFIVFRWFHKWPEAFDELTRWIRSGQLKAKEHVTEGLDNVVNAFVGMLKGENFGKAVVKSETLIINATSAGATVTAIQGALKVLTALQLTTYQYSERFTNVLPKLH